VVRPYLRSKCLQAIEPSRGKDEIKSISRENMRERESDAG
jgi:hypothetical protein